MEVTKGKLINLTSKAELVFGINPSEYRIDSAFDFVVEPRLGKPSPVVAFRSGGGTVLGFSVMLDKDADDKLSFAKVDTFLKSLHKVEDATLSVPKVQLKYGALAFSGFVKKYEFRAYRFDAKGEVSGARVDFEILSDGSYEGGET